MSSEAWWRGESADVLAPGNGVAPGSLRSVALRVAAEDARKEQANFTIFMSAFTMGSESMGHVLSSLIAPEERKLLQDFLPERAVSYGYDGAPLTVVPELQQLEEYKEAVARSFFRVELDTSMEEEHLRLLVDSLLEQGKNEALAISWVNIIPDHQKHFPSGIYALMKPKVWSTSPESNADSVLGLLQEMSAGASIVAGEEVSLTVTPVPFESWSTDWLRPLVDAIANHKDFEAERLFRGLTRRHLRRLAKSHESSADLC